MSLLKLSNVNTGYGKKHVLYDVSIDVQEGETLLIVGNNGSGKSTLLKVIYGLINVWDGIIEYKGELLHDKNFKTDTYKLLNKGIMYIPQKDALFEDLSVEDNIQYSLLHLNDRIEIKNRVKHVLGLMPDLERRKKQLAGKLSGGERKLLSLAIVLVNRPKLLLYDEPLAGISENNIPIVNYWLETINKNGVTILIVEHRTKELLHFVNRLVRFDLGNKIEEQIIHK